MQRMRKGSRQASFSKQRDGSLERQLSALAERAVGNELQQVFDKADAVVFEHHAVAFLGRIKIDIGTDGKIMIAVRIAEGLPHMPYVLRILVGFIDSQECH